MKAKPLKMADDGGSHHECEPSEATHVMLHLPGPIPNRIVPVIRGGTRAGTGCWSWNSDTEKPTLKPSILTKGKDTKWMDEPDVSKMKGYPDIICHTFITDGKVQFLSDSTHELAGQTLDLLNVE